MRKTDGESELEFLQRVLPHLPGRQRRLADFVRLNYRSLVGLSSIDLANAAGVSESTVVRTVRALGYAGYVEFQRAWVDFLRAELVSDEWLAKTVGESTGEILETIVTAEMRSLERLLRETSAARIERAIALLGAGRRVYVLGAQSSSVLAFSAAYELGKIRPEVRLLKLETEDAVHALVDAEPADVALVFGFPRYPSRVLRAVDVLRDQAVPFVSVVHNETSPFVEGAAVAIPVYLRYYTLTSGYSPAVCLLNAIVIGVARLNETAARQRAARFEQVVSTMRVFEREV